MYDVIIVGGGPAGLSAALILGRCRRKVLVCDSGHYRNAASHALNGYLTRDGTPPSEFLRIAREELAQYKVEYRRAEVTGVVRRTEGGFQVTLRDETVLDCLRLLVATGVTDRLPTIGRIEEFYGKGVAHCPYCDGWELRDRPLVVYGNGKSGAGLAVALKTWSERVTLCTDGRARIGRNERARLDRYGIPVREESIDRLDGDNDGLKAVVFRTGETLECGGLFFNTGQHQACNIAADLGCIFTNKGAVQTNRLEGTNVEGVYVAGDASRDVQLVIVAAAEGAKAGFAINQSLQQQERP